MCAIHGQSVSRETVFEIFSKIGTSNEWFGCSYNTFLSTVQSDHIYHFLSPVDSTLEKFEKAAVIAHFGTVFEKNLIIIVLKVLVSENLRYF